MQRLESALLSTDAGQGKCAATILTESGWHYPVISELSYLDRVRGQTTPFNTGRGARPMHTTTMLMVKPPWDPKTGFKTTTQQYYGDIKVLNDVQRPTKCRSMHSHQFALGDKHDDSSRSQTMYRGTYMGKPLIPANRLHRISLVNRIDQTEGRNMKAVFNSNPLDHTYWTQYNRVHNKLGLLLGPGQQRSYRFRQQFNPFTGEDLGPAWKEDNKRISGNRSLYEERQKPENKILLN